MKKTSKQERLRSFVQFAFPIQQAFIDDFLRRLGENGRRLTAERVRQFLITDINNVQYLNIIEQMGLSMVYYLTGKEPIFADNENGQRLAKLYESALVLIDETVDKNPKLRKVDPDLVDMLRDTVFSYVGKSAATGNLKKKK